MHAVTAMALALGAGHALSAVVDDDAYSWEQVAAAVTLTTLAEVLALSGLSLVAWVVALPAMVMAIALAAVHGLRAAQAE